MGVYRKDYVIYGWKLPYKMEDANGVIDPFSEKFEPYLNQEVADYILINDGMGGYYKVFGIVIAEMEVEGDFDCWEFESLATNERDKHRVINKYKELFGVVPRSPSLFIFSHIW